MITETNKKVTKLYASPEIVIIELDTEISLALQSAPPVGPEELTISNYYSGKNPFEQFKA